MQFSLVLEELKGKKMPESSRLESLGTFSAYNFTLSNAEDNTINNLRFENTISNLPEVMQAKFLISDSLFY